MITSSPQPHPHPHPLLSILPRPHPTTSLTLPTFLPHFIPFTPTYTPPPTPGRNGPKGVKIIDHSFSPTPTPVRPELLELELARTHSNQSIDSTALITPQAQSPLTNAILLRNDPEHQYHHQHLSTPIIEGHDSEEEGGLVFGTIHFEKSNNILPIDTFMEVQPSQITIPAINPHQPIRYRRTYCQPQTSFARGEIIHHKFPPFFTSKSTLYRSNRNKGEGEEAHEEEEEHQSSDSESGTGSESSGCSSIIPPEQMGKMCMYEYWRMYDQRIKEEREERRRLRKFTVASMTGEDENREREKNKAEGKVRDWLVSQNQSENENHPHHQIQNHHHRQVDQPKTANVQQCHSINHRPLRISINTNHTYTKQSSYSPLSPEPWLAKPHLDTVLALSVPAKMRNKKTRPISTH